MGVIPGTAGRRYMPSSKYLVTNKNVARTVQRANAPLQRLYDSLLSTFSIWLFIENSVTSTLEIYSTTKRLLYWNPCV